MGVLSISRQNDLLASLNLNLKTQDAMTLGSKRWIFS